VTVIGFGLSSRPFRLLYYTTEDKHGFIVFQVQGSELFGERVHIVFPED
jgi:hypothetical protein